MLKAHPVPKIAFNLILNLLLLFSFPLAKTFAEPDTYGPFEIRLESAKKTYYVGEELEIKIIISHTYPASLPGTFVVELYHKGLKEWEYLSNFDVLLPVDTEFTLKKFGVPAFNTKDASVGEWRVRVYPLRDQEKAQELSVMITADPKARPDQSTLKYMNITRTLMAATELAENLKKRGHLELAGQISQGMNEYSRPEDYGKLAGYFKSLDLSVYKSDIKSRIHEIVTVLERVAKLNPDDFNIKKGDLYILLLDADHPGTAQLQSPVPKNFECVLPEGTVFAAASDKPSSAFTFDLVPEDYDRMETRLVPKDIRNTPEYSGYYFTFTIDEIGEVIKKVE